MDKVGLGAPRYSWARDESIESATPLRFLGTLAVAFAASLGYTWLRPAEYRASARLEITPAAGALPLGPAATSTTESPRPFLTETQVLTSRPVLRRGSIV